MKIVIDISAEDFEKTKCGRGAVSMMRKAIIHGIPLPKGHGRLIDADAKERELADEYHGMISDESMKIYKIIQMLDDTSTIIEADTESEVKR